MRTGKIQRNTLETKISLELCLDGGEIDISTGIGFFDHMLNSFAIHGKFGLKVKCDGDLHVDCHHTIEDVGIALGKAFTEAISDKKGIERFGDAFVPMDEALGFCSLDISGRPFLVFDASFEQAVVGQYDTCMTEEFMRAFAFNSGITLHLKSHYGSNSHHVIEALFKALARALRTACMITSDKVMSAKGVL